MQNIRKSSDFEITDKVRVELSDLPSVREALSQFSDYVASQVLANEILLVNDLAGDGVVELDIDGEKVFARVSR